MTDWDFNVDNFIEWADGSVDAVYVNQTTGDAEWRPATPCQAQMFARHKEWVAAGRPDMRVTLSEIIS
jgi:hypothetical protein